jgi:very-short-patch-repair endonuclease
MDVRSMFYGASPEIFSIARELRLNMTRAEKILWNHMRKDQLVRWHFRRQHPIATFVVDFYCHKAKLVVELDGGYHNSSAQREYDGDRTQELEGFGLTVLRLRNEDVQFRIKNVIKSIRDHLEISHPASLTL